MGREDHLEVREGSGSPPVGSEGHPGGLGVVGRPTWRSGSPTRKFSRGWKTHLEVRKAQPDVREGVGGPPV